MSKTINNWKPEVNSLIQSLLDNGCVIVCGNNGEEEFNWPAKRGNALSKYTKDAYEFVNNLIACDDARLFVKTPTSKGDIISLYLMLGNSPGELVCDYTVDATLDKVTDAHYAKWKGVAQPKKPCPHYMAEKKRHTAAIVQLNKLVDVGLLDSIYYGAANFKPIRFPVTIGARFYGKDGVSCGQECYQTWYGVAGSPIQTEVLLQWVTDEKGKLVFPRK